MKAILAVALMALVGCQGASGTRCDRLCRAEADCAEKLDLPDVDRVSCVESCNELERDPRTAVLVEEHARCVAHAKECVGILDCP